jgi:hypothetical protein
MIVKKLGFMKLIQFNIHFRLIQKRGIPGNWDSIIQVIVFFITQINIPPFKGY